jgi:hypothetical protein
MDYSRTTSRTFDMNEYFSGERFEIGGRDYDLEDREELALKNKDLLEGKIDQLPGRGIKEILRAIRQQ